MRAFGAHGPSVPIIGQGTWKFPERGAAVAHAKEALRAGIELGMVHIDTAEMYGSGRSEEIIGEAIAGFDRESLFIVSKVLPTNASRAGVVRACDRSLQRLGVDYLDVYLLHWRGSIPLAETIAAFEKLIETGKIRRFGVSNFDVGDLEEAASLARHPIACNQVYYSLEDRGIEADVIPYCSQNGIAVVGYSPFGSGGFERSKSVAAAARAHGCSPHAIVLAFLTRLDGTFAIPKASNPQHVAQNARGGEVALSAAQVAAIDAEFAVRPGPLQVR
jgi:diketogulonate reductase-like aldo/keto reductase